jgi:hypothetical protein
MSLLDALGILSFWLLPFVYFAAVLVAWQSGAVRATGRRFLAGLAGVLAALLWLAHRRDRPSDVDGTSVRHGQRASCA